MRFEFDEIHHLDSGQSSQPAVGPSAVESGKYTGLVITNVDGQLEPVEYQVDGCSSHRDAADRVLGIHADAGGSYPELVLIHGACRNTGCACEGEIEFAQFLLILPEEVA